jgi:hypothetical protein
MHQEPTRRTERAPWLPEGRASVRYQQTEIFDDECHVLVAAAYWYNNRLSEDATTA